MERVRIGTTSLSSKALSRRDYVGRMSYGGYDVLARTKSIYRGELYECSGETKGGAVGHCWIRSVLDKSENSDFIRIWQDLAASLIGLRHPGVLECIDRGKQGQVYYVIQEFVEGCTLNTLWQEENSKTDPHEVIPLIIDVLEGLTAITDYIGKQGKDIGPAISLVPSDIIVDRGGFARLGHIACSRAESMFPWVDLERAQQVVGYRAPEQLSGGKSDLRSEVFSAGIVLWQACARKRLFAGSSAYASAFHVLARPIPRLSSISSEASVLFDTICRRALDRDPTRRFSEPAELAEFLRKFVQRCYGLAHLQELRKRWGARVESILASSGRFDSKMYPELMAEQTGVEQISQPTPNCYRSVEWSDLAGEFERISAKRGSDDQDLLAVKSSTEFARTLAEVYPGNREGDQKVQLSLRHARILEGVPLDVEERSVLRSSFTISVIWSIKMLMWVGLCMVVGCLLYVASRMFWQDIYPDLYSSCRGTVQMNGIRNDLLHIEDV